MIWFKMKNLILYIATTFNTKFFNMKKITTIVALFVLCLNAFSQKGIVFSDLTFEEALSQAKAEKKLVFMDCYTSWCGACKQMQSSVFSQEKAGTYFNRNFICIKYDMGQKEGKKLADQLGVKAYPTYFLLCPDGSIQHKMTGFFTLDDFIVKIQRGSNKKTSYAYLDKKYSSGKISKKELIDYQIALQDAFEKEKSQEIAQRLTHLITDKDKLTPAYWPLMALSKHGSDDFRFILSHLKQYRKKNSQKAVDGYLYKTYNLALNNCLMHLNTKAVRQEMTNQIRQELSQLDFIGKDSLTDKLLLAEACVNDNNAGIISGVEKLAPGASGFDRMFLLGALDQLKNRGIKAEYARIAALGDKLASMTDDRKDKEYFHHFSEPFKIAAHTGIYFQGLPYEKALEKARKQNKILFVDCYTSWCGPCKIMATQVFPQEKVGDYFNDKFICLKYDIEKEEGKVLGESFQITSYPTFLFINADGTLRHKLIGGVSPDELIEKASEAFDENIAFGCLEAKYKAGNRDKCILTNYVKALIKQEAHDITEASQALFEVLTDEERLSKEYWFIYDKYKASPKGSEADKFLLAHREQFNQLMGKEVIDTRISQNYSVILLNIFLGHDTSTTIEELNDLEKEANSLKVIPVMQSYFKIGKAVVKGSMDDILSTCEKELYKIGNAKLIYTFLGQRLFNHMNASQQARWRQIKKGI